jgi:hypothetical protein
VNYLFNLFYRLLPVKKVNTDELLFVLTNDEIKSIRRKETIAIWLAAFIGAMGVVLLYLPQYWLPKFFTVSTITLAGKTFVVPITTIIYTITLVVIEIILLTFLNIWCAHEIAVATGFLNYQTKKHESDKRSLLISIGLEKKNKEVLKYGIDPLQDLNRKALLIWNLFFILKATLSNMLFKVLIQRLLGRYAVKAVQDFAGIPIFALWNAYGTKLILKEARVIIMGQNLVEVVIAAIKKDQPATVEFKNLLYNTLQYIAVSKRDFHQNHFVLTKNLFEAYNITANENPFIKKDFIEKLLAASKEEKEVCQLLICIGFILDGKISFNEQLQIKYLQQQGLIDLSTNEIRVYQRNFLNGKGINGLIKKYIN